MHVMLSCLVPYRPHFSSDKYVVELRHAVDLMRASTFFISLERNLKQEILGFKKSIIIF